jgi:hypothetical protein
MEPANIIPNDRPRVCCGVFQAGEDQRAGTEGRSAAAVQAVKEDGVGTKSRSDSPAETPWSEEGLRPQNRPNQVPNKWNRWPNESLIRTIKAIPVSETALPRLLAGAGRRMSVNRHPLRDPQSKHDKALISSLNFVRGGVPIGADWGPGPNTNPSS